MADRTEAADPAKVGLGQAALLTGIVVVALTGFIMLGHVLGIVPIYGGLLLFWYWLAVHEGDFAWYPPAVLGALGGTTHAWLLQWTVYHHSMPGVILFLVCLIAAIFVQIAQLLPIVINPSYMLFLTVMCAPLLQSGEHLGIVLISILAASAYFGLFVLGAKKLLALREARAAR